MTKKMINQEVAVTAVYFRSKEDFDTYPRRIEFEGTTYTFADGIRYLVRKGEQLTRLFDMTDGQAQFRLRQDADNWTLVAISR